MFRLAATLLMLVAANPLSAQGLHPVEVAPGVYAIVGPLGQRDPDNLGNNATFGLVLTADGAVLIDPGGSYLGAEALDATIQGLTDQPVVAVIDTGGQDHRWLGNGYWSAHHARIIASEPAVADQKARASIQLSVLTALIGDDGLAGTEPRYADVTLGEAARMSFGGVDIDFIPAPGHTPGDMMVWLAGPRVVFAGDLVFTDRLLGVRDHSDSRDWVASFETLAALDPAVVVPGHGGPTDLATATRDTYDYLVALRGKIGALIEAGGDILAAPDVDQSAFSDLANFDTLAGANAQTVFSEMEWE